MPKYSKVIEPRNHEICIIFLCSQIQLSGKSRLNLVYGFQSRTWRHRENWPTVHPLSLSTPVSFPHTGPNAWGHPACTSNLHPHATQTAVPWLFPGLQGVHIDNIIRPWDRTWGRNLHRLCSHLDRAFWILNTQSMSYKEEAHPLCPGIPHCMRRGGSGPRMGGPSRRGEGKRK